MRAVAPRYITYLVMSEHAASDGGWARQPPSDAPSPRYTLKSQQNCVILSFQRGLVPSELSSNKRVKTPPIWIRGVR